MYIGRRFTGGRLYRSTLLAVALLAAMPVHAGGRDDDRRMVRTMIWRTKVDSIAGVCGRSLQQLVAERDSALSAEGNGDGLDVYSLRMVLPPTFYSSSVLQQFSASSQPGNSDVNLMRMYMLNESFARMYAADPSLVEQTDEEVQSAGTLRDDVQTSLTTDTKLSDHVVTVDLNADIDEGIELVTRKPNFWKISGDGSLQFTQSYFSDNWYKGGENNYAIQGLLTLRANYDNKDNFHWENCLEVRLGFQTTGESDKFHSVKPTDNMLRLTTKMGYKAISTFYYTTQVQANTQLVSLYESNSDVLKTNFLSPLDVTVSVGMDYKFCTKNNRFSGNVYVAPCAYNLRYVRNLDLSTRYGLEQGRHTNNTIGSSITVNANWQIAKNISWSTRIYWISDYSYTNIEWENTFNFSINRYLSAKLFAFPKFEDSSDSYKGDHGFLMMKEWFSLGLNYSW